MPRFNFSTGILSPINSDISVNDASAISSGSLPGSAPFDETETSVFESSKNDSKVDSFHRRNMKESTAAVDLSNDKKKNINVEKEVKYKESYEILKHSMDELVYKYAPSSVLSPVSNDADIEKVLEAKKNFQTSVLSPVLNDADVEEEIKAKNILPELKSDVKNAYVLSTKILRKSGYAESKSSQHSNSKLQKKKDSNARNNAVTDNQQSKCTDPLQKSQKETMKKNLKRLELQPEGKEAKKVSSSATELQNSKDSKKTSPPVENRGISAESGNKEKENLKNFYTQKQKKSTVSNSQSITDIQNLSVEKSVELAISMEMDRLRGFILDQNMSLRKEFIKLHETVKKQNDVIGYLFCTVEDLKAENKKLVSKMK